jgi:hypothetical protein
MLLFEEGWYRVIYIVKVNLQCTGYTLLIPAHVAHNTTNTDTDNLYQHKINGEWRYLVVETSAHT